MPALYLCLLLVGADASPETPAAPVFDPTSAYEKREIHGWTVYVNQRLLTQEPERSGQAIELLGWQLFDVTRRVRRPEILAELRKTPIWMELNNSTCACYHPDADWLRENNYNPEKVQSIEIGSLDDYLNWTTTQPGMILHELAHAYHNRVLGDDNPRMIEAWKKAVETKKYDSVLYIDGRQRPHYLLTDHKEYFAEATEAYLTTNDYWPFVRGELEKEDPEGARLMREIWDEGKRK